MCHIAGATVLAGTDPTGPPSPRAAGQRPGIYPLSILRLQVAEQEQPLGLFPLASGPPGKDMTFS